MIRFLLNKYLTWSTCCGLGTNKVTPIEGEGECWGKKGSEDRPLESLILGKKEVLAEDAELPFLCRK